jgi:hypothetical protein
MTLLLSMVLVFPMAHGTNDNEPDPWTSIGWQANLILNRLRNFRTLLELTEEQQEQGQRKTGGGDQEKRDDKDHSEYVEQRVREIAKFEQQARGETVKRRKI